MHLSWALDVFLFAAAFCAGVVDTVAGGGGLICVPALGLTGMGTVAVFGTNKLQSVLGQLSATLKFWRQGGMDFSPLRPGLLCTVVGALAGAMLLQIVSEVFLKRLVPWMLLGVFLYYVLSSDRKDVAGEARLPPHPCKLQPLGVVIGFYNGFFGPGTGSIWTVALSRTYQLRINAATMYANPLNMAGNIAALSILISSSAVDYRRALIMGAGSFLGAQIGGNVVIHKSARLLRTVFMTLMLVSIIGSFLRAYG
ncbi:putative membrane spanning protein [Granulibacter bethesdensis]|uniref:Probable membrane transporter protein n=1 Tax=Granulibacter bethesdensis TaxID=364410 RepID=A0AAN0VG52_9PROT|nr:TSUP family transporter [Granulibacter bethesdensis]AHJ63517.1 putative membrane spanning protein [Granulibacter bethesdensis]